MTRVRVEPRPFDQGRGKNDALTHSATLPTKWYFRERDGNFETNRKSYDSSYVWCEAIRSKKQRGVDG